MNKERTNNWERDSELTETMRKRSMNNNPSPKQEIDNVMVLGMDFIVL